MSDRTPTWVPPLPPAPPLPWYAVRWRRRLTLVLVVVVALLVGAAIASFIGRCGEDCGGF